jgi:hypothetical protein
LLCFEGYFKPADDNLDIGWQWNSYKDKSKKTIVCDFGFHPLTGIITRAKKNQLRMKRYLVFI